jgi:hypothetical protein
MLLYRLINNPFGALQERGCIKRRQWQICCGAKRPQPKSKAGGLATFTFMCLPAASYIRVPPDSTIGC